MNIPLDLTGTQLQHPHISAAITALGSANELFNALASGVACSAWFLAPTAASPRLLLTWRPSNEAPINHSTAPYWTPFYVFRADHSTPQHVHRMLYALKAQPILLAGEYTHVEYLDNVNTQTKNRSTKL
jgi:hypothetical protein